MSPGSATQEMGTGIPVLDRRYDKTLRFLKAGIAPPAHVLDLGTPNPFSKIMEGEGFTVTNTEGDLDLDTSPAQVEADAVTAFEILEHLVAPFNVLRDIRVPRLFVTVPLKLWFAPAYRNRNDPWDRHFHEFEDWQFEWLLEKAGWRIVRKELWTSPVGKIGLRPLLRRFTPRYLAIEAIRP